MFAFKSTFVLALASAVFAVPLFDSKPHIGSVTAPRPSGPILSAIEGIISSIENKLPTPSGVFPIPSKSSSPVSFPIPSGTDIALVHPHPPPVSASLSASGVKPTHTKFPHRFPPHKNPKPSSIGGSSFSLPSFSGAPSASFSTLSVPSASSEPVSAPSFGF